MKGLILQSLKKLVCSSTKQFLLLILCAIHVSALASPELVSTWIKESTDQLHITMYIEPISTICFYLVLLGILLDIIWFIKNDIARANCFYDTLEYRKLIESRVDRLEFDEMIQKTILLLFFLDILNRPQMFIFEKLVYHFNCFASWSLMACIIFALIFQIVREKIQ